jgi:hypothetical protein
MRRLMMLTFVAAVAAGCRATPAPQPCCRPTYSACTPCNTCNTCGGGVTIATPAMSSPMVETYTTPSIQSGPTMGSPGPQTYAPTTN